MDTKNLPKILFVEDSRGDQVLLAAILDGKAIILSAFTIEEAELLFESNPDVRLVIMDACVPGNIPNTMELVGKLLSSPFRGPIIAASDSSDNNQKLMAAGCSDYCLKGDLPTKIREVIAAA